MKAKVTILSRPRSEAQHQANIINWALLHREEHPELALLYHIPNGGSRDPVEARHLKDQGVKRGVPDLCLPVPRGHYHGLYMELKTETSRATAEQEWWGERLCAQGYAWRICHGWQEAVTILEGYLSLGGGAAL